MNTTVNSLGSSSISIGNSVAGQVAQNTARDGFNSSVSGWSGGSSYGAAPQKESAPSNEESNSSSPQQQQQNTPQQGTNWQKFYNLRDNPGSGSTDYSSLAYDAMRMQNLFAEANV